MYDDGTNSYLLPDKNRNSKQKTPVAKRSVNPVWNYTFAYDDVSLNELSERALELTIWDHGQLASNEFLGGVRFSLGTGKHWMNFQHPYSRHTSPANGHVYLSLSAKHFCTDLAIILGRTGIWICRFCVEIYKLFEIDDYSMLSRYVTEKHKSFDSSVCVSFCM